VVQGTPAEVVVGAPGNTASARACLAAHHRSWSARGGWRRSTRLPRCKAGPG
jgi:hypothetical protein